MLSTGEQTRVDQGCFSIITDDVSCSLTSVDVQAGDAPGMVMVEHKAGTLLIGVVEGHTAVIGRGAVRDAGRTVKPNHIGHLPYDNAFRPARHFVGWSDPLVGSSI